MAKLARKTQKIFSSNSATNEHAVFGTMRNIVNNEQPQYSMDIEDLQSETAFLLGFQAAVVAGFAPFLEELNSIIYIITTQLAYILNNGVAEYDSGTTYYVGDVVKIINNGVPIFKYSIVDNNLNNDTGDTDYWEDFIKQDDLPIATVNSPGIVQPDGITIFINNNGIISASGGANTDLSNLTNTGNSKFQYTPFSINSGILDNSGGNNTLQTVGDTPSTITVTKDIIPILTADSSIYGICSVVGSYSNAYLMTNNIVMWTSTAGGNSTVTWSMALSNDNHIPSGASCTFNFSITGELRQTSSTSYLRAGCQSAKLTFTYTDDSSEDVWSITPINPTISANYTPAVIATKEVKTVTITASSPSAGSANDTLRLQIGKFTLQATYTQTISSADTLICYPCTITTADSKTKSFNDNFILDCSTVTDGTYKVLKSYTDGSLNLISSLPIQKTAPLTPSDGDYWLDNSQSPLSLKKYALSNYTVVGTPNISPEGIVSDFSGSNYLTINALSSKNFKLKLPVNFGANPFSSTIYFLFILDSNNREFFTLRNQSGAIQLTYRTSSGTSSYWSIAGSSFISANTDYLIEIDVNNSNISTKTTNISSGEYVTNSISNFDYSYYDNINLIQIGKQFTYGQIDLKQLEIYVNDELIYTPVIQTGWINNDNVYIGEITVSTGLITAVKNNYFNACPARRDLIESYQNGSSYYTIYSDGWCVQSGKKTGTSGTIDLLKTYLDTNYLIAITPYRGDATQGATGYVVTSSTSSFTFGANSYTAGIYWHTEGYIKI